ncbi:MAG: prephenate dehydrogenase [Sphingobacteriales bacterium]|nr:MAG: prephenate dehydrogenase [Sphingobacteriales bacterium]
MFNNVTIVGVGLISGSFALALKQNGLAKNIIGVSRTQTSLQTALQLGIIDEALPLEEAVKKSNLIYVAIPVDATLTIMQQIMDMLSPNQIVVDAGSTKYALCNLLQKHPNRKQFVATHPMWGTEYSGPMAAIKNAFVGSTCVICEKNESDTNTLQTIENVYKTLGMHLVYMDAQSHDTHAAYVSHISHITSFALANTVLEKEKQENAIFELAAGGFASTVRLAKSSPAMWTPIFLQNKQNILEVLNEHISQLQKFKTALENNDAQQLQTLMQHANTIGRILK